MNTLRILGIDPLLFRDGRAFTQEEGAQSARTLPMPLPSSIAGALRTHLGETLGWDWKADGPDMAMQTACHGPLLLRCGKPVYPSPADAVVMAGDENGMASVMALRPFSKPQGVNLPDGLLPLQVTRDGKPAAGYTLWQQEDLFAWLQHEGGEFAPPQKLEGLPVEERVHVSINPFTGTSEDAMLFTTRSLCWEDYRSPNQPAEWEMLVRMDNAADLSGPRPLGGERRLAAVCTADEQLWPACPASLQQKLANAKRVRMLLATPALFAAGWNPADSRLEFTPQGAPSLTLRLAAAAVKRREPAHGWDWRHNAPKAVRWMAPAGSVYFFDVLQGSPAELAEGAWLAPQSSGEQDRRDGFGLSLWGVWE